MPRAGVVRILAAPNKTRWTLAQNEQSRLNQKDLELVTNMQANGAYFDHEAPLPRYESYDGSQYSVPGLDRASGASWRPPQPVSRNGHRDDFSYNTPLEERASHKIMLDTRVPAPGRDVVGQHLLYETAMQDSQPFEMLQIAELDALKKELARLEARIEAADRKLALESKVKDAARNLQRLYSVTGKSRPDTPQSPDSPKRRGTGLLGHRGRTSSGSGSSNGQPLDQARDELATSVKKVEELKDAIKSLLNRRQYVERRLLTHTAAVLAKQHVRASREQAEHETNGYSESHGENSASMLFSPDEYDGIRDILHGAPASSADKSGNAGHLQKMQDEHVQQMASVQTRLEQLNDQLRHVIGEASRTRGVKLSPERQLGDQEEEPAVRLNQRLDRLEDNLHLLSEEQQGVKTHYARLQDGVYATRNAVEEQLEGINNRLHNTLLLGADMQNVE
ncbi:hypothetical protein LTR53_016932, partial [Teratosphaeriaceae sp. CCFEE 6253]